MKLSCGTNHVGDNEKVNWTTLAKCPVGIAFDSRSANLSHEPIAKYSVCVCVGWGQIDAESLLSLRQAPGMNIDSRAKCAFPCRYYIMNANGSRSNICNMILASRINRVDTSQIPT